MQALINLTKGLEILDPFLKRHHFYFANYQHNHDFAGEFIVGTYECERKKFVIDYRFQLGQVLYQYDNAIISHQFYLDRLGFANKKMLNEFNSNDSTEPFKHILHDFDFLVDDFFEGTCSNLLAFSKLKDNIFKGHDKKSNLEVSLQYDTIRIEKARQKFREKDFIISLALYNAVENKNLLNELDHNIIAFAERNKKG